MKFSEEQAHKVKLHHRELGDLGEAHLRFGGEQSFVATGGMFGSIAGLDPKQPLDFVTAISDRGYTFTLCNCHVHGFSLYLQDFPLGDRLIS